MDESYALSRKVARRVVSSSAGCLLAVILLVALVVAVFNVRIALLVFLAGSVLTFLAARSLSKGSHQVALAAIDAQSVDAESHPRLVNLTHGLCVGVGLPMPGLWVAQSPAINALSVSHGTDSSAIVLTSALLESLTRTQLEGVIAFQLARIRRGESMVGAVAATCLGGRAVVAGNPNTRSALAGPEPSRQPAKIGLPLLMMAPVTRKVLGLLGDAPHYPMADFAAVEITRYPPALVSAYEKATESPTELAGASPALTHLWMFGRDRSAIDEAASLVYSLPRPIEERIAALQEL